MFGQPTADIWFKIQNQYDFWHTKQTKQKKVKPLKAAMHNAAA